MGARRIIEYLDLYSNPDLNQVGGMIASTGARIVRVDAVEGSEAARREHDIYRVLFFTLDHSASEEEGQKIRDAVYGKLGRGAVRVQVGADVVRVEVSDKARRKYHATGGAE